MSLHMYLIAVSDIAFYNYNTTCLGNSDIVFILAPVLLLHKLH